VTIGHLTRSPGSANAGLDLSFLRREVASYVLLAQIHYIVQGSADKAKQDLGTAIQANSNWLPYYILATIYE
jgi:hypothetical protein